jgi:hypothetical protein
MNQEQVEQLVFDSLAETLAQLGCAGPPECKMEACDSKGEHETELSMCCGVITVGIDNLEYEVRITLKGA